MCVCVWVRVYISFDDYRNGSPLLFKKRRKKKNNVPQQVRFNNEFHLYYTSASVEFLSFSETACLFDPSSPNGTQLRNGLCERHHSPRAEIWS
jgi:hypothetical protein